MRSLGPKMPSAVFTFPMRRPCIRPTSIFQTTLLSPDTSAARSPFQSATSAQMEFATKEARLKSFEPPTKRSKAGWPHKSPTADAIATAGFYYTPHKIGEDNVKCFMCDAKLDGWEKDDDPVQEHLRHSPECGYAILMSLVQQPHFDTEAMEDPTSTAMEKARRSTFDLGWPHDSKRGWTCKTEKMVEAGWHFMPSSVSEDYASCAYCKLSLDGWEPKDNPL